MDLKSFFPQESKFKVEKKKRSNRHQRHLGVQELLLDGALELSECSGEDTGDEEIVFPKGEDSIRFRK